MTDRTTINIASDVHTATRDVKEEYNDSWTDVLQFYREHRHEVGVNDDSPTPEIDTDAIADTVADRLNGSLDVDPEVDVARDALAEAIADRVDGLTGQDPEVLARQVSRELDYTMLADKTAENIKEELR